MKKKLSLITLLAILLAHLPISVSAQIPNTWTQKADFGSSARYGAVGFSIGTKGYMGTGYAYGLKNDFWEYDPATDTWTQKADFAGTARMHASGFSIGAKGYIACGWNGSLTNDFWEYNPTTNTWTQKADFAGLPRTAAIGMAIGTKGYVGTGLVAATTRSKDFWEYDPATDIWTQKTDLAGNIRAYAAAFSIGSKGYIGTGNSGALENDFWEYTPATDSWLQKANFPGIPRYGAIGFTAGTSGYIGLGDIGGSYPTDLYEYNPTTNAWTAKANFTGSSRTLAAAFGIGSKGYVGTGYNQFTSTYYRDFYEYNPTCAAVSITTQPADQSVVYGNSVSFSVVAENGVDFQWQQDAGSGFTNVTNGGIFSNATTSTLNISLPTVAMSGYKYRCVVAGNCLPIILTDGNATLQVSPAAVTVTANAGQGKVYGNSDPVLSYTHSPALLAGNNFSGALGRDAGENTGTYAITQGTLSAGNNYTITFISNLFTITAKPVTVNPVAGQSKIYGDNDPASFTFTLSPALISPDVTTGSIARVAGENAGTYSYTIGTLTAGSNYILTLNTTPQFEILPAALTITAENKYMCYTGSPFAGGYSVTYTGFKFSDNPAVLTGSITYGGTAIAAVNPGNYSIVPSGVSSPNYSISYLPGTLEIAVAPAPTVNGPVTLCAGATGVVYTTEAGYSNYVWTISYGGMITAGLNSNSVSVDWATAGSRTISVNYQNPVGCFSNQSTSLGVQVKSVPVPIVSGITEVCSGTSNVVYNTQTNQENYIWTVSSGGIITSGQGTSEIYVTWNGSGNQTVSAAYTNELGCDPIFPTVYNVNVSPLPSAAGAISGPASVCAGSTGVIYSVDPVANANSYEWTIPTGATIVSGNGSKSITLDFTAYSTSGPVKVKAVNDCGSGAYSPILQVQVNSIPATPVITQLGDTAISSATTGNQWYIDGVAIPGATGQKHVCVFAGNYHVEVTINGCTSAPSNTIFIQPVAIDDWDKASDLTIYPNPSDGKFNLLYNAESVRNGEITVYNNSGKLVKTYSHVTLNLNSPFEIDLQQPAPGLYLVNLIESGRLIGKKLILIK